MYGALATGCGYSFRTIDRMSLAEVATVFAYWADNPPPHLLLQAVARALGWRPASVTPAATLTEAPPPGLIVARGGTAAPAPVFDLAELRRRNRARAAAIAVQNAGKPLSRTAGEGGRGRQPADG